ncbi:uncharacterized protein LOC113866362 [Abrus precatorius]|uniref:Uncharacterized protein LOC113866362 n=1 Tax=Abrus precatorius TaxID=3816 RepID=A0A8B8LLB2_ABRPR|nr:uncharacterized protein LOC113866362 [Abrus precatorius]
MAQHKSSSNCSRTSNRSDPGWKYAHSVKDGDTNNIVCNFCGKVMSAGITRVKQHLIGKKCNVKACPKCPEEVRKEIETYQKEKKNQNNFEMPNVRSFEGISYDVSEDEEDTQTRSVAIGNQKGPMDLFCRKPESAIEKRKKEKLRQTNIRERCDKEAKARVHQYIARFWYQAGLSFNLIKMKSFQEMLTVVGAFGPNLPAPSYHDIRVPLLKKELEYTDSLMKDHKEQWSKHGCSIMSDAWTDRKQRCLINFLVNSPTGTMFVRSNDGSNFVKTGEKLFEMLDALVEEIGEDKVVQVITDNGSNYVLAGKMLEAKRPHLYWTPCAAHCIDLMLEDIGKLPLIKKTIQRGISVVGFIYSHSSTLSLLRNFTNKRELVRHAVTRFATSFLSLERLHQEKENLRKMFTSEEWCKNKISKEAKGKQATKILLNPVFWNNVVYTLKIMAPLVRVLCLVDGERRPAMGYIYEAMEKSKEAIMKSFKNNESKYKDVLAIIDNRWTCQLHCPLHAAGHILNPEFYYDNPQIEFDLEVTDGLYDCIKRLVPSRDVQQSILLELPIYKSGGGLFGSDFAKSQRKSIAPGNSSNFSIF